MNYRIEYDPEHEIAVVSFHGIVTESLFLEGTSAGRQFIRGSGAKSVIVDFSNAEKFDFPAEFLRKYAMSTVAVLPVTSRILVASQDSIYGLARLFQVHRDPGAPVTNVVRSLNEAYAMLGAGNPRFTLIRDSAAQSSEPES